MEDEKYSWDFFNKTFYSLFLKFYTVSFRLYVEVVPFNDVIPANDVFLL